MGSFDGSSKGFAGIGQNINYHEAIETPHMKHVIEQAMRNASPEAIAFLDPLHPKKPDRIDASGLTEEEWKRRRVRSIGSSAASHVFGECPYPGTTNLDLYYEKTGQVPPPTKLEAELAELCDKYGIDPSMPDSKKRQWYFDFGHIAEDIMHRYCEYLWPGHELIVDTNIYSSPARPFLTANLDRMMKLRDGSYIHVEFKTASAENKDGWRKPVLDPNTGEYFEEWAIPQHYKRQLIQCQHIMGVWESVLVVMFDRDNIIPITYYRDLDEEMYQVKVCEDFWMNHVLTRVPPDLLLGDPKNLASCIRRYSGEADAALQTVSLPREFLEAVKKSRVSTVCCLRNGLWYENLKKSRRRQCSRLSKRLVGITLPASRMERRLTAYPTNRGAASGRLTLSNSGSIIRKSMPNTFLIRQRPVGRCG